MTNFSFQEELVVSPALVTWKNPDILHQLKTGNVVSKVPMQEYLISKGKRVEFEGKVFWVQLGNALQGVFKELPADEIADA